MRILSGKYKGKKLVSSKDNSIRPTTNKIKEIIFNVLQDFCEGKIVADIFCGSGNLGIEALSRGAKHIVFVDTAVSSINVLQNNLKQLKLQDLENNEIINSDAIDFSNQSKHKFDLILMDPPFDYPPINQLLHSIFKRSILKKNGILVVEHEISNPVNCETALFEIIKQKKIGRSLLSFIVNKGNKSA